MDVLIIHYNTPELTSACVKSLWKHTPNAKVTIFDNSDKRPFPTDDFPTITYLDNTQGQIVNWDEWLATFPNKEPCPENNYGSAKHCYSVELCYDMFPNGFVLMDSDVLIRQDITPLCDKKKAFVGRIHCNTRHLGVTINRLCPWICWINTPMLKKHNIRYFNPDKMWKLHANQKNSYYDTGAWLLMATLDVELPYDDIEIFDYIVHLRAASWHKFKGHNEWLNKYNDLWNTDETKIYICTHKDFTPYVTNPVYEVVDARNINNDLCDNGLRGAFYSELFQYRYLVEKDDLPPYVGFCSYRKYFKFRDNVPDIPSLLEEYDAIATKPIRLRKSVNNYYTFYRGMVKEFTVKEWYAMHHNIKDLDIVTEIIKEHYNDLFDDWIASLEDNKMYSYNMFIVKREDFKKMMELLFGILDKFVEVVGTGIQKRIREHTEDYHIGEQPYMTREYQYRIGGFLGERITNAILRHMFHKIKEYDVVVSQKADIK